MAIYYESESVKLERIMFELCSEQITTIFLISIERHFRSKLNLELIAHHIRNNLMS